MEENVSIRETRIEEGVNHDMNQDMKAYTNMGGHREVRRYYLRQSELTESVSRFGGVHSQVNTEHHHGERKTEPWEKLRLHCGDSYVPIHMKDDYIVQNLLPSTNYCDSEEIFRFPHYLSCDSHMQESLAVSSGPELLSSRNIQWREKIPCSRGERRVRCCDFPQDQDFHIWLEHNLDDRGHSPAERLLLTNQQEMVGLAISQKTNKDGVHRNLDPRPRCDYTSKRHKIAAAIQIILSSISIILCLLELLAIVPPFRKEENRTRATTYNLYLVFLAIPDLTYNMFLVILFSTYNYYMSDPEDPEYPKCETETERESNLFPKNYHEFDIALFASCAFVTLYMNALIFYEILKLLRNSKRRQRCNAPTFGKACLQALLIYVLGVVVFIIDYNLEDPIFEENDDKWWRILIYYFIVAVVPISYLIWVPFRVWREGLIKYDSRFGRLTCLLNYFSRIICVYVFFWIPASILFILQYVLENDEGFFFYLSCNCYAIQVWVSFGFVIMKPDIRRDVLNLLLPAKCQKADQESHSDYSPSIERQTKPLTETEPGLATAERSPSSPSQDSETSWCIGNSTNQWDSMFLSSNAKSGVENQQMRLSDRGDEESENLSPASLIRTAVKDSSCSSSLKESQRNKPSMTDTLDCEHACACLAEESMNNVNYVSKTDRTSRSLNSVADGDDDEEFGSVEGNVVDDYNKNDQNIHPDRDTDTDRDNWEGNQSVDGQEAVES